MDHADINPALNAVEDVFDVNGAKVDKLHYRRPRRAVREIARNTVR